MTFRPEGKDDFHSFQSVAFRKSRSDECNAQNHDKDNNNDAWDCKADAFENEISNDAVLFAIDTALRNSREQGSASASNDASFAPEFHDAFASALAPPLPLCASSLDESSGTSNSNSSPDVDHQPTQKVLDVAKSPSTIHRTPRKRRDELYNRQSSRRRMLAASRHGSRENLCRQNSTSSSPLHRSPRRVSARQQDRPQSMSTLSTLRRSSSLSDSSNGAGNGARSGSNSNNRSSSRRNIMLPSDLDGVYASPGANKGTAHLIRRQASSRTLNQISSDDNTPRRSSLGDNSSPSDHLSKRAASRRNLMTSAPPFPSNAEEVNSSLSPRAARMVTLARSKSPSKTSPRKSMSLGRILSEETPGHVATSTASRRTILVPSPPSPTRGSSPSPSAGRRKNLSTRASSEDNPKKRSSRRRSRSRSTDRKDDSRTSNRRRSRSVDRKEDSRRTSGRPRSQSDDRKSTNRGETGSSKNRSRSKSRDRLHSTNSNNNNKNDNSSSTRSRHRRRSRSTDRKDRARSKSRERTTSTSRRHTRTTVASFRPSIEDDFQAEEGGKGKDNNDAGEDDWLSPFASVAATAAKKASETTTKKNVFLEEHFNDRSNSLRRNTTGGGDDFTVDTAGFGRPQQNLMWKKQQDLKRSSHHGSVATRVASTTGTSDDTEDRDIRAASKSMHGRQASGGSSVPVSPFRPKSAHARHIGSIPPFSPASPYIISKRAMKGKRDRSNMRRSNIMKSLQCLLLEEPEQDQLKLEVQENGTKRLVVELGDIQDVLEYSARQQQRAPTARPNTPRID